MSEGGDREGDTTSVPILSDADACKELDQEDLLSRVRKMNDELQATRIPLHHVPVALVVENITREKMATSWFQLCQSGGRPSVGRHIGRAVRSAVSHDSPAAAMTLDNAQFSFIGDMHAGQQQRRALTWEDEYPRSRYRGDLFKPPLFDDEPSDSDDES